MAKTLNYFRNAYFYCSAWSDLFRYCVKSKN